MDNYIVSARKYRPTTFDSVIGQASITATLKNAIKNNHLAQAFLFCGPRGVGKTTCARILAKTINCFSITENIEACNECESCKSFDEGRSLNIYELDGASNNSVDDIRNLIDQVRFAPQIGTHKVYIIDEVHMLSQAAFNAFLKTLEEPPKHAIFILATTEKHKIIPTILSRCQIFDFNRIQVDDISTHLAGIAQQEEVVAEQEGLHIIAQKGDGSLRDALSMFDQIVSFSGKTITYKDVIDNLNILDYDYYFRVTDAILNYTVSECLLLFDEILNNGFDGHNFINGLAEHFRNLLVCQDEQTKVLLEVGPKIKDRYIEQTRLTNINQLISFLNVTNKADTQYKSSKNQRLLVEVMLMQLCSTDISSDEKKKPIINIQLKKNKDTAVSNKKEAVKVTYDSPKPSIPVVQEKEPSPLANPINADLPPKNKREEVQPLETSTASTSPSVKKEEPVAPIKKSPVAFVDSISINPSSNTVLKEETATTKTEVLEKTATPYTLEQFAEACNDFKLLLLKNGKVSLASIFTSTPPIENDVVNLILENKALEDEFKAQQADFLSFMRKNLANYTIQVTTSVNKNIKLTKAYTPQEKFIKMSEKNPKLKQLVKKLDMDIGYT